jgi:hypothetical protein
MATGSKTTTGEATAAPTMAAPADGGDAALRKENAALRAQLADAGIRPKVEPYVPSFPMSQGVLSDLQLLKSRADHEGRDYDATGPDGQPVYTTSDPVTGRVFTIADLPAGN